MFRERGNEVEVLLGHMGGPFWRGRDSGAWSIPKGEYGTDEVPRNAALREFREELGVNPPAGELVPLGEVRQSGGKRVHAWAVRGELDPEGIAPGTFTVEWPRGSGILREFPELDRVSWFGVPAAETRIVTAQRVLLHRLVELVEGRSGGG